MTVCVLQECVLLVLCTQEERTCRESTKTGVKEASREYPFVLLLYASWRRPCCVRELFCSWLCVCSSRSFAAHHPFSSITFAIFVLYSHLHSFLRSLSWFLSVTSHCTLKLSSLRVTHSSLFLVQRILFPLLTLMLNSCAMMPYISCRLPKIPTIIFLFLFTHSSFCCKCYTSSLIPLHFYSSSSPTCMSLSIEKNRENSLLS